MKGKGFKLLVSKKQEHRWWKEPHGNVKIL